MPQDELPNLMRTLLAAGFGVERVERKPNYLTIELVRPDAFGVGVKYLLAYAGDRAISSSDQGPEKSKTLLEVTLSPNTNFILNRNVQARLAIHAKDKPQDCCSGGISRST